MSKRKAKKLIDDPVHRLQRAKARIRSKKRKLLENNYDGQLYEIEHPSQKQIQEECLKIQETWSESDIEFHIKGFECDQYHTPILSAWYLFEEQEKKQKAISEGRLQRLKSPWYGNQLQEHHDFIYHGQHYEKLDQPVWWEGI